MEQHSTHFPDCFYRVTVKGLYVEGEKLLVMEDAETLPVEWELPGGGMDFGETPQEALVREVKEEMNLDVSWVGEKPLYAWTKKRLNRRNMEWFYILALCYPMKLEYKNFVPTESCKSIEFWNMKDMRANKEKMANQMHPLVDLFNPKDFI